MIELILVRHGSTPWNEQKLYQGRTDIPLSETGQNEIKALSIPESWKNYRVMSSPLQRAFQTAELLFPDTPIEGDSRLMEINFGSLEGTSIEAHKASQDFSPPTYGWKGWDFAPPGGESYEKVAERLLSFLDEVSLLNKNIVAVTHKGVILTALALAHGWDMKSKRPFKMKNGVFHVLTYSESQGLRVSALNQEFLNVN